MSNEIFGSRLNTLHNLFFYAQMMEKIRQVIQQGRFVSWAKETLSHLEGGQNNP